MVTGAESDDESVSFITYFLIIYFYVIELHVFDILLYYYKRCCNYEERNTFCQAQTIFHIDNPKTVMLWLLIT